MKNISSYFYFPIFLVFPSGWFHKVLNHIWPNNGQEIQMFINGQELGEWYIKVNSTTFSRRQWDCCRKVCHTLHQIDLIQVCGWANNFILNGLKCLFSTSCWILGKSTFGIRTLVFYEIIFFTTCVILYSPKFMGLNPKGEKLSD